MEKPPEFDKYIEILYSIISCNFIIGILLFSRINLKSQIVECSAEFL